MCTFCELRGRKCVMQHGPKKEKLLQLANKAAALERLPEPDHPCEDDKSLQLAINAPPVDVSRSLPTSDYAVLTQDVKWRLAWLFDDRRAGWVPQLLRKIFMAYGRTISCHSLRFAILAYTDDALPYEKQRERYLRCAIHAIAQKAKSSGAEEGEFLATSMISLATQRLALKTSKPKDPAPLASRLLHLRWFHGLMYKFEDETNGNISGYTFGQHWSLFLYLITSCYPLDRAEESVWDGFNQSNRLLRLDRFETWCDAMLKLAPCNEQLQSSQMAWQPAIGYRNTIIHMSFGKMLENSEDSISDPQRTTLQTARCALACIERSEIHHQIWHRIYDPPGIDKFSSSPMLSAYTSLTIFEAWLWLRHFQMNQLLLTLMLDADHILHAANLPNAVLRANSVIQEVFLLVVKGIARDVDDKAWDILHTVICCLVYPVAQDREGPKTHYPFRLTFCSVREAAMKIVSAWAHPYIAATIGRYWSNPAMYFYQMLEMVRLLWKSSIRLVGRSGDFEEGRDLGHERTGIQFWN